MPLLDQCHGHLNDAENLRIGPEHLRRLNG